MGAFLKFIPAILAIIKRGKALATLAQSKTTKAQYTAILIAACILAAVGYFVPVVADNDVAVGLIVLIVPVISRLLLYKDKAIAVEMQSTVWICKVRNDTDGPWREFDGMLPDAIAEGAVQAVDDQGRIWDVPKQELTGETIRLSKVNKERNAAAVVARNERVLAKVKAAIEEAKATQDGEPSDTTQGGNG